MVTKWETSWVRIRSNFRAAALRGDQDCIWNPHLAYEQLGPRSSLQSSLPELSCLSGALGPSQLLLGDLRQVLLSGCGFPLHGAGMGSCTVAPVQLGRSLATQQHRLPHRAWPLSYRTDRGQHCPDAPCGPYCLSFPLHLRRGDSIIPNSQNC